MPKYTKHFFLAALLASALGSLKFWQESQTEKVIDADDKSNTNLAMTQEASSKNSDPNKMLQIDRKITESVHLPAGPKGDAVKELRLEVEGGDDLVFDFAKMRLARAWSDGTTQYDYENTTVTIFPNGKVILLPQQI